MKRTLCISIAIAVGLLALWVQACRLATRAMNPDENQFVASAALLAREGKLPYVDFPYMHLPQQTLALAGLYRLGADHLLLTARIMNATLGVLTLALVAGLIISAGHRRMAAWMLGLASALALLFNPLFAYTSGLAWNHDGSVLLLLCSVAALWRGLMLRSTRWIGAAGLLLGLATGVRSTIAPVVVPILWALLWQVFVTRRLPKKALATFIVAGMVAQIPTLILAAMAPERFLWGNVGYALLNTRLREDTAFERAMSLRDKVTYLRDVIFPWNDHRRGDLLLLAWAVIMPLSALAVLRQRRASEPTDDTSAYIAFMMPPLVLLAGIIPFALVGSLLPTPSWAQYYYVVLPLLLVSAGCAVAHALAHQTARAGTLSVIAIVAVASLVDITFESVRKLDPEERGLHWPAAVVPLDVHTQGLQMAAMTQGRVLTVDPIYPLEGGRQILPELVSGAYAYRVGRFIDPGKRKRLLVVGADDLVPRIAQENSPPAILIREPRDMGGRLSHEADEAIRIYAIDHGWKAEPIDARHTLYQPR